MPLSSLLVATVSGSNKENTFERTPNGKRNCHQRHHRNHIIIMIDSPLRARSLFRARSSRNLVSKKKTHNPHTQILPQTPKIGHSQGHPSPSVVFIFVNSRVPAWPQPLPLNQTRGGALHRCISQRWAIGPKQLSARNESFLSQFGLA